EESALRFADEMLASLGDTYTERMVPPVVALAEAGSETNAEEKPSDVLGVLTPNNFGYLRITSFDDPKVVEMVDAAVKKIASCDGVILDLRQNSGGRMHEALACCGYFVANGLLATLKFRHAEGEKVRQYFVNEDQFFAYEQEPNLPRSLDMYVRQPALLAGKPIVIILNRRTASAGEMMICALVQNGEVGKVHMVGSGTTPGKGIGQAVYELQNSDVKIRVTRSHWFARGGEWLGDCGQTEANGIDPDTLVENDRGPEALKVSSDKLRAMLEEGTEPSSATSETAA
ncbi:MAG: hypothetical protein IAF58_01560, partial [Leptolyngbya sp.]|nr:hypothetical protein [Candidatus Melainabacteria bacterium]